MRGTDVAAMMTRVETTLAAAERSAGGASGVLPVAPEGDAEVNVSVLRTQADIRTDFPPGSARPVVGAAVRLGKRTLRRAVRWYVTPMMEQQSRMNHALLDGIERLRVRIERLGTGPPAGTEVAPRAGDRAVAVGTGAAILAEALVGPSGARPGVADGDPVVRLHEQGAGSLDLVVADVAGMDADALVALLTAATAALRPGAAIVLSTPGTAASLHHRALAWALAASGFVDVCTPDLPPPPPFAGGVADRVAAVDELARATGVLVAARRPR